MGTWQAFMGIVAMYGASLLPWATAGSIALTSSDPLDEDMSDPQLTTLFKSMQQAMTENDHALAHEHVKNAMKSAPYNVWLRGFNALLALFRGSTEEAYADFHVLVRSQTAAARFPTFLQQYLVSLHRLGKKTELADIWPQIAATPGIQWRSPLHCPELIDDSLLDGAAPFPHAAGLRVPELLKKQRRSLHAEFLAYWRRSSKASDWQIVPDHDLPSTPGCWTEIILFHLGEWSQKWCKVFAMACKTLKGLPEIEGSVHGHYSGKVSLLKLDAGTYLRPHFGAFNWRYTAHLGLLGAEGGIYRAGGKKRSLQVGEVFVLDDSFLHDVANTGTGPRVNLVANFFHPKTDPQLLTEDDAASEL